MLNNVEFRDGHELVNVDKVKIVACDGKSEYNLIIVTHSLTIECCITLHYVGLLS